MVRCSRLLCIVLVSLLLEAATVEQVDAGWRAGVASASITPSEPIWMSGYASRDRPAEGTLTDLHAKCLVLEDGRGHATILVTLDLLGIHRQTSLAIRQQLADRYRLTLADVALCTSHTHCGPVVGTKRRPTYDLDEDQWVRIERYAAQLEETVTRIVAEAVDSLAPAELAWGKGRAAFAVNRRENREADVVRLRDEQMLRGPVDHEVPVLRVLSRNRLRAIVCGYACHATTLSFYQWCGDYPGFAQAELEQSHPEATVLFFAGCGADQNPLPRRTVELAQDYGRQLATAVEEVLQSDKLQPLTPGIRTAYAELDLPFAHIPDRSELEDVVDSGNRYEQRRALMLLTQLEGDGAIPRSCPYPIQTWRLGDLTWVLLGGEVVVDYALRLKGETPATFVAAYANDVLAYIPSERVLREGGYEGATAMVYYGLPSPWAPGLEDRIVGEVVRQIGLLER